ncbi:MAG: endolytic transglycosylase MltG [Cytophagaceae bacterium]|nr:endolytic transglycosylase MltG [Cytophagaceae bacterium]MDW8456231.1 endolytic transglycosylase MltG [Cytophagaceae bacterium]
MGKKSQHFRIAIVIAGIFFVSFSYYVYQILYTKNIQVNKDNKYLYIPTGASFQTVLDSMSKDSMINDKVSFMFLAKLLGYRENVKPGKYLIEKNSSNLKVIRLLRSGRQEPVKLTFNSIRTKEDLVRKLSSKLEPSVEDFNKLLNDPEYCNKLGFDTNTIVSMFLPNTYEVYWNTSAEKFIERMKSEYEIFWNAERRKKAQEAGFNPVQVSILASIVEAETNKDSEKARIAGVYINRLATNMPLQADPTVKFALRDFEIKRITKEHIKTNSPYNTYMVNGLPPGPINLPSLKSIDAVLNYEKHKYLYFCASAKRPGYHDFAENYRDHINNANRYHTYLDNKNIK